MILGAVLAGGQSSRFGSDKALAELDGRTLLDHAVERMAGWCDSVVIVGREDGPAPCIADWPRWGMGPLAGIGGALRHAKEHGFSAVLTCPVDALGLPHDLPARLSPAPAFVESQPVIGLWPVDVLPTLEAILQSDDKHSLYGFVEALKARPVAIDSPPLNINRPEDLASAKDRLNWP